MITDIPEAPFSFFDFAFENLNDVDEAIRDRIFDGDLGISHLPGISGQILKVLTPSMGGGNNDYITGLQGAFNLGTTGIYNHVFVEDVEGLLYFYFLTADSAKSDKAGDTSFNIEFFKSTFRTALAAAVIEAEAELIAVGLITPPMIHLR